MYLYNFLLYYFHYGCTRVYVPGSLWNTQISFTTCYLAVFGTQIYTTFSGRAPHVYMTCTCTCSPFMFKSSTALPVPTCVQLLLYINLREKKVFFSYVQMILLFFCSFVLLFFCSFVKWCSWLILLYLFSHSTRLAT